MMRYLPLVLAVGLLATGVTGMYTLGRAEPAYLVVPLEQPATPLELVEAYEPVTEQVIPALEIPVTATATATASPVPVQALQAFVAATATPAPAPLPVVVYSAAADPSANTEPLPSPTVPAYDTDALQAAIIALQGLPKPATLEPAPQVPTRGTPLPVNPVAGPQSTSEAPQPVPAVGGEGRQGTVSPGTG